MNSSKRAIGIWLLSGCVLIFCMVIIGGITRLTGSGLSITEWKPIMGAIPPLNENDWQIAFDKYKQIPQYQRVNYDFTLDDFKSIFWWEYIHRLLGRVIGIVFIIPFLWFYFKGMFDNRMVRRMLFLFFLGALQGVIGWVMVSSGLTERTSVSHIRLAIHLLAAFITFGFTFYYALEIIARKRMVFRDDSIRSITKVLFGIVIIQICYGAFVAGLHAGKIYNTFPLMNGSIVPEGLFHMSPAWLNIIENHTTVQFIHRSLAWLIAGIAIYLYYYAKRKSSNSPMKAINILMTIVLLQFWLGVFTLLLNVRMELALLHQAGAFFLFSACIYMLFITRKVQQA